MSSNGGTAGAGNGSIESLREETRRSMLAKAGLVAGAAGLVSLAGPGRALGQHADPLDGSDPKGDAQRIDFDGYNNIRHWGAHPSNDGAENRALIQQCIDESAGKATVYVPPDTFLVGPPSGETNGALELPSNTVIVGHGSLSVLKATDSHRTQMIRNKNGDTGNSDIRIENLTLDGNRSQRSAGGELIRIGVTGEDAADRGRSCERVFIRGVECKEMEGTFGIHLAYVKVGAVEHCYLHDGDKDGIHITASEDVLVEGNLVRSCGDDCIGVTVGGKLVPSTSIITPKRIAIVGNVCNGNEGGFASSPIAVRGGEHIAISGNVCRAGSAGCIAVTGGVRNFAGVYVSDVVIASNVLIEAGRTTAATAPALRAGSGVVVQRGAVQSTFSQGEVARILIGNNVIDRPLRHGVFLSQPDNAAPMSDIQIIGNTLRLTHENLPSGVTGDYGSGIHCVNSSGDIVEVLVSENEIRNCRGPGMQIRGNRNKRWEIRNNRVLDSGIAGPPPEVQPGILLDGLADFIVAGNRSQDTRTARAQSYGLTLLGVSGNNFVHGNYFFGNLTGAISPMTPPMGTIWRDNLGNVGTMLTDS